VNTLRVSLLAAVLISCVSHASDSAPKPLLDKLKSLAGADSQDCGTVLLEQSPDAAIACAEDAGASGRAYRFAIEFQGTDGAAWQGAARDGKGKLWAVYFDFDPSAGAGSGNTVSVVPCREIRFAGKGDDVIQCKPVFGER
jgi:hypothetical protein